MVPPQSQTDPFRDHSAHADQCGDDQDRHALRAMKAVHAFLQRLDLRKQVARDLLILAPLLCDSALQVLDCLDEFSKLDVSLTISCHSVVLPTKQWLVRHSR